MGARAEIQGERLGYWCAPKLCYGHVLASLAAADDPNKELAKIIAELEGH